MCWGQITCIPDRTYAHDFTDTEFYHWEEVGDLNVEFKLIKMNLFMEWPTMNLWLDVLCLEWLMKTMKIS
jgi:hypothetical protein